MTHHTHDPEQDDRLDRLLLQLGSTRADPGFEERILRRVQARAGQAAQAKSLRRPWLLGCASGLALAGIALAVALLHTRPQGPGRQAPVAAARQPPGSMLPAVASSRQGDFGSRHTGSEQHLGRGPVPRQERGESAALQAPSSAEQAVSFPAPPLPLTTEEKLLLRLAHHGDPAETAMLNPANREAEEKAETAQFEQFFPPPAPPPNEVANAEAAPATPAPR